MKFESAIQTNNAELVNSPSEADIQAALELISENDDLRNHPRVQQLIKTNFVTEDGRQLDPGNFLSSVLDYLKQQQGAETESPAERRRRIEDAMVVFARGTQHT